MLFTKKLFSTAAKADPRRVTLKPLPYEMGSLEPVMSGKLLDFHYGKHHRGYVMKLNELIEQQAECTARGDLASSVRLSKNIHYNAGGHLNHEFFWDSLCTPADSQVPTSGPLSDAIKQEYGSVENFIQIFNSNTAAIQGSGWGWLCMNAQKGSIEFRTTRDEFMVADLNPNLRPLLNIDVWEHSYYLEYQNNRIGYLKKMWNIVNWNKVEERFVAASAEAGN